MEKILECRGMGEGEGKWMLKIGEFDGVISWVRKARGNGFGNWKVWERERKRRWPENGKRWAVDGGDKERDEGDINIKMKGFHNSVHTWGSGSIFNIWPFHSHPNSFSFLLRFIPPSLTYKSTSTQLTPLFE